MGKIYKLSDKKTIRYKLAHVLPKYWLGSPDKEWEAKAKTSYNAISIRGVKK